MANPDGSLARILGTRDLTFLFLGSVIGSGIFLKPGQVLHAVNSSVAVALGAWALGGVFALLGTLTYAELGATNPATGGPYVYLRDCFGRLPAFLFGWVALLALSSAGIAALAVAFSSDLARLAGALQGRGSVAVPPIVEKLLAIGVILALALVNVRGTRQGADLQNWTTAVKVGALLIMSALLLLLSGSAAPAAPAAAAAPDRSLALGFGAALIGVLWAYNGWQPVACSVGETVDARRVFPRASLLGVGAIIGIYLLANIAYAAALGPAALARSENAAVAALGATVGPAAANLVSVAILISILGAINATYLTFPRVFYAMALDRLFFRKLGEVHPRFGTPAASILVTAVVAVPLAATGTFEQLTTCVVFVAVLFDALVAACIFHYRRHHPREAGIYGVPGYPWTPLIFILASLALIASTVLAQPREALLGIALVAVGLPVYRIWRSKQVGPESSRAVNDPADERQAP